jgi:F-type H+-transporting ATPase subunit a
MRKRTFFILAAIALLPVVLAGIKVAAGPQYKPLEEYDPLKHIGENPPYFDVATGKLHMGGGGAEGEEEMPPMTAVFVYRLVMTWFVIGLILVFAARATKRFAAVPTRVQGLGEIVVGTFDTLTRDTLGDKARRYFPLVTTLFLFIVLSNWLGMIPKVWEFLATYIGSIVAWFDPRVHIVGSVLNWYIEVPDGHWLGWFTKVPTIEEPTADLNTTLGCGLIVFFTAHAAGIKHAGFREYFRSTFCEIEIPGAKYVPVLYIPVVVLGLLGELGKLVSHSFRLFGNILGGSVIGLVVVSLLMRAVVLLPVAVFVQVGINLFMGLFVGAVQAFVFAMLAMVYIAIKIPMQE